jgi:hypothetical protein
MRRLLDKRIIGISRARLNAMAAPSLFLVDGHYPRILKSDFAFQNYRLHSQNSYVGSSGNQFTPMKATLGLAVLRIVSFLVLLNCVSSNSFAQGTVNFATFVSGELATRIYRPNPNAAFWPLFGNTTNDIPAGTQTYGAAVLRGTGDPGPYLAQIWAAPGASQPESALQPASPTATISNGRTGAGVVALTNIPADLPVATMQIRVWQLNDGFQQYANWPDYYTQVSGGFVFGKSMPFNVEAIGGGTNPPPNLTNFRSFSTISNLYDRGPQPLIYVQPQSKNVAVGGTVTFHAETALPSPHDIHWQFNGTNVAGAYGSSSTNSFAFPGFANGGTLALNASTDFFMGWPITNVFQITNVQPAQAGLYNLVASNYWPQLAPRLFTFSSNAVLTVGAPGQLHGSITSTSELVLDWDGVFILQSATNIQGPFVDLPGPIIRGPYTNMEFSRQVFFRLRN